MAAPPVRTVRQIIESAYRKISVYAAGETISADDINAGLIGFQDLLAELAGEALLVPSLVPQIITLVIDQRVYTIGEDGAPDLDAVRPDQIVSAFVREGGYDYPVRIIGEDGYNGIYNKSSGGTRPRFLWYNPTVPNGEINVFPPPSSADSLYVYYPMQFSDSAILTADIMIDVGIPRNYHNPLVFLLAIDLAPEHGIDPSMIVAVRADQGKDMIRSLNAANSAQAAQIDFVESGCGGDDLIRYG